MVALVLSMATIVGVIWLIRLLIVMPKRPVLLDRRHLVMRVGTLRQVDLPTESIARVHMEVPIRIRRDKAVLDLALLAHPNGVVDLIGPLPGRPAIRAIAHRLDDPSAFVRAFDALRTPA